MDRKLAAEINKHLLDAAAALRRADRAGQKLTSEDERRAFIELLADVIIPLHFELLRTLYAEHPDLEPPHEPPRIVSTLRWEKVALPPTITAADIDAVIFDLLKPRLQKMAKVVGEAFMRFQAQSIPVSDEIIAARIIALEEAGRIESAGDLRKWRHSEVRLP
jgi:uncharacterized protein DUF3658